MSVFHEQRIAVAARLVGLRVPIPPEARVSVFCECCVEVSASG
jgi:hypothetical protein